MNQTTARTLMGHPPRGRLPGPGTYLVLAIWSGVVMTAIAGGVYSNSLVILTGDNESEPLECQTRRAPIRAPTTSTEGGTMPNPTQRYRFEWRAEFSNEALNELHAEAFNHAVRDHDWLVQVSTHSLGWVCAFEGDTLIGFVNVPWDGAQHAFIIDPVVLKRYERQGIGTALVALATEPARAAGCKWLHVDFDEPLRRFYFDACGFTPTIAGLIDLSAQAPIAGPTADSASR
jgi:GNAT superfamily N-acetyltransferase